MEETEGAGLGGPAGRRGRRPRGSSAPRGGGAVLTVPLAAGLFSEAGGQLGLMGQRDHHSEFSFLLATDVSGSTGHGSSLGRNVLNCCGVDTLIS